MYTVSAARDAVRWYWRSLAIASSLLIVGGFLMLPATFENNASLRVPKLAIGIFAIAIITAGFSLTALLSFAVRNPIFQAETIFLPSLVSCTIGLLTIIYGFIISTRYEWNVAALLSVIAAALGTAVYAGLLIYSYRKIGMLRSCGESISPLREESGASETSDTIWQEPAYYKNYIRNMFPTSTRVPGQRTAYDPTSITEEEMQRQQMLMLLLHRDQMPTPATSQNTFRIEWQSQDQDDLPPAQGFYAPQSNSASTVSSANPVSGISPQWTSSSTQLRPWDGVWREPASTWSRSRATSQELREERRRQIEMGH